MKPQEVVERLFDNKRGVTAERIQKAQALAKRMNVDWQDVLKAMSDEQRQQVS